MDYRLTDPFIDPPSNKIEHSTEKPWHLPSTYWCYPDPRLAPAVRPSPFKTSGFITFGCLSNFAKVNEAAIRAWIDILTGVSGSRLLLHTAAGMHRQALMQRFAAAGIDPNRISFISRVQAEGYFASYNRIDIAFDTVGYKWGTTTLDALWMGVPVVSLAGNRPLGRGGVSILSNIGLHQLIASDQQQYTRIAESLAASHDQLAELRRTLRDRLFKSTLMDAKRFVRDVEKRFHRNVGSQNRRLSRWL